MELKAFLDELTKIASSPPSPSKPIPINAVAPRGPSVPSLGLKVAMPGTNAILPGASATARRISSSVFPKPSKAPVISAAFKGEGVTHTPGFSAAAQNAATVPPPRRMAPMASMPPGPPPSTGVANAASVADTIPSPASARTGATVLAPPSAPLSKVAEAPHKPPPTAEAHKMSVEKLRQVMMEKHPHLLVKKPAPQAKHAFAVGDIARHGSDLAAGARDLGGKALHHLHKYEDAHEVAGLAALAAPSVDNLQAKARGSTKENDKHLMSSGTHDAMEVGGLGYLAAPLIAKRKLTGSWAGH